MKTKVPVTRIEPGDGTLRARLVLAGGALLSLFSLVSWRLIYLQVEQHERYASLVDVKHQRKVELEAHRGRIFDARGLLLAGDEPVQKIIFDLGFLREKDALASALVESEGMKDVVDIRRVWTLEDMQQRYLDRVTPLLAQHVGKPVEEIRGMIAERMKERVSGEVWIHREVPVQNGIQLRDDLERLKLGQYQEMRGRIGAVVFRDSFVRRYPATTPVFHFAGKLGEVPGSQNGEMRGACGLEKQFNEQLEGKAGYRMVVVDGLNNELAAYRGEVKPPVHGANLRSTIDTGLQELVLREIDLPPDRPDELSVAQMHPDRVIVVLFEPKTMAVRSVVTRDFKRKPDAGPMLVNDLVEYLYAPGSTIKVATIAAALSTGKVSPHTEISLANDGGRRYHDSEVGTITDDHAFPSLSVEGIMVHSSNIGAFKLGKMMGLTGFKERIAALGFTKQTGITLPTEQRGWFPRRWNVQSMSRAAFGYAYMVTPAQLCALLGCVLNGGEWCPLRAVEAWTDEHNRTLETIEGPAPTHPITAAVAGQVRQMLLQVVEKGTGKLARSDYYEIGGKTGTANKVNPVTKSYDDNRQTVSFLGYVAGSDGPKLGGLIIIDEPKLAEHLNYGGRLAAPLFRRIAEKAMAYYDVPAQFAVVDKAAKPAAAKHR
ncbi:MAG TPA: penicillin-binding protein 2 [Verrucomicrobiales bacterium]|nr:penicillin-binding protein 2 [Verrucomicrobiales bacterium]